MASRMIGQTAHRLYHSQLNSSEAVSIATVLTEENGQHNEWLGNDTIDVMQMGCSANFNTVACVRNGLLCLLALTTGIFCLVKICRLHMSQHPTKHLFVIFYCAAAECVLCAVHWALGAYTEFDFIIQWLKFVQFLLVSHLYWIVATRVTRKECLTNRIILPVYLISLLYFTLVVVFGCIHVKDSWIECFEPYWLALSSAELLLVQLFTVAALYLSKRLDEISTLGSIRQAQKRDLWLLVVVFEVSAVCGFVYDLSLRILATEDVGCSGVFHHAQQLYTPVYGILTVVRLLLPMWALLLVFHPIDYTTEHAELVLPASQSRTYTSVFSPPHDRHRYRPVTYAAADYNTDSLPALEQSLRTSSGGSTPTTPVFGPWGESGQRRRDTMEDGQEDYTVDVSQGKPLC